MINWLVSCIAVVGLAANVVLGQAIIDRSLGFFSITGQFRHSDRSIGLFGESWQQRSADTNAERAQWKLSHRFQGGWEYDSNIYESSSRRTASGSSRFLLNTRGDRRATGWQAHYNYSTALQAYSGYGNENKLSHDLAGYLGARLRSWLHVSAKANGTLKFYLESAADYGTTSGNVAARFFLPHHLVAEVSGETGQLDYAATDLYDFTFNGVELTLRRPLTANGAVEMTVNQRSLRYQREAFAYDFGRGLFPRGGTQRDALTTCRVAITYGRKTVMQLAFEAQANRSNSFGYDFNRWRVSGLLGFRPAPRWMLRAAGLLQNKRYRDDLSKLKPGDIDTEREQSNFLVMDLSRDLSPKISLLARAAFYDNESIVLGKFYRKTLFFTGVEIRL